MFTGLKPCRECQHKVSLNAKTCPNCGAKRPGEGQFLHALPALFALLLVGSCAVAAYSQETTDTYYDELMQWVFEPCSEVAAALSVTAIDGSTMRNMIEIDNSKGLRKGTAQYIASRKEAVARDMAAKFGKRAQSWERRREGYPVLLKWCIQNIPDWSK